jgi:hypothetical protein
MIEIQISDFLAKYESGQLSEVVVVGTKIYARMKSEGLHTSYTVVWAAIP